MSGPQKTPEIREAWETNAPEEEPAAARSGAEPHQRGLGMTAGRGSRQRASGSRRRARTPTQREGDGGQTTAGDWPTGRIGQPLKPGQTSAGKAGTVRSEPPHADPGPEEETAAHHGSEAKCKLVMLPAIGTNHLTPSEVPRIIRAARAGVEGSLDADDRIEEGMQLFAGTFTECRREEAVIPVRENRP
jgi:hypothetical protein